jgi:hypothetical protein
VSKALTAVSPLAVDSALDISETLQLEVDAMSPERINTGLGLGILIGTELSFCVPDLDLRVLHLLLPSFELAIPVLQRFGFLLAEVVADDAFDGSLRPIGTTVRECLGRQVHLTLRLPHVHAHLRVEFKVVCLLEGAVFSAVGEAANSRQSIQGFEVPRSGLAEYASLRWLMLLPLIDDETGADVGEIRFPVGEVSRRQAAGGRLGSTNIILDDQIICWSSQQNIFRLADHFNNYKFKF